MVRKTIEKSKQNKKFVQSTFKDAADKYDFLNDLFSMGFHRYWKRYAVNKSGVKIGSTAIDLCSGTLDIAILLAKKITLKGQVVALDFNEEMLQLGKHKADKKDVSKQIKIVKGDVTNIPFPDNTFDAATIGFGLRNVEDRPKALGEMLRVIKQGGKVVILEFTTPPNRTWRKLYDFYSHKVMPKIGNRLSYAKDSYKYLVKSIREFPMQEELITMMLEAGFQNVTYKNLTGGIVAIHTGEK
jgi:demethylmenaquinone methyltransferase/2-methoxy-6-polyprenyl-1,4-benzoquinol methylase